MNWPSSTVLPLVIFTSLNHRWSKVRSCKEIDLEPIVGNQKLATWCSEDWRSCFAVIPTFAKELKDAYQVRLIQLLQQASAARESLLSQWSVKVTWCDIDEGP
uniref:Uncharacterized protein n=1 Tax=Fusarium oxysporum (strain Fo5176) TaxID=660025 RepID=A0A0D2XF23_FUSOF